MGKKSKRKGGKVIEGQTTLDKFVQKQDEPM
jgi:hypothetical protein